MAAGGTLGSTPDDGLVYAGLRTQIEQIRLML